MDLETRMRDRFAKRLARFVQKEREKLGCAKTAMKKVAAKLGMSAIAVYRAMNGYGPVSIKMHHHAALIINTVLAKAPQANAPKSRAKQAMQHIRGRLAEVRA